MLVQPSCQLRFTAHGLLVVLQALLRHVFIEKTPLNGVFLGSSVYCPGNGSEPWVDCGAINSRRRRTASNYFGAEVVNWPFTPPLDFYATLVVEFY